MMSAQPSERSRSWLRPLWYISCASVGLAGCAEPDLPLAPRTVLSAHDTGSPDDGTLAPGDAPTLDEPDRNEPAPDGALGAPTVAHVIVVSIDGLATRYLDQLLDSGTLPAFAQLQTLAAWTHNARTDKTHTITLPNHTCMLTGLPVSPVPGYRADRAHGYIYNGEPGPSDTLHNMGNPARTYTPSIFDVAHDAGMRTGLYASKTKFVIYEQSYNGWGAPDITGRDDGKDKIDEYVHNSDTALLVDAFIESFVNNPPRLSFVHMNHPDVTGHTYGWGSEPYLNSLVLMDQQVRKLVDVVQSPAFSGRTALILTTDHGGVDNSHLDPEDARNYTIPFYLLAPGTKPGDAYDVLSNRYPPAENNPGYEEPHQPLRNGDAGNLALGLLGLPAIPGSVIHSAGLQRTGP